MPLTENIWHLGARLMASAQARDEASALRLLDIILRLVARESRGRFSYYKLRTLQVLTNANRAAFNAGAPTEKLAQHSLSIVIRIDRATTPRGLLGLARAALRRTIRLVPATNDYRERLVDEAVRLVRENFAGGLTRGQVAARLRCSPAHFSRIFARTTGLSFKDYVLHCRLEKARELLQHSHLHVAEIAGLVGYEDPFQFSKVFRKRVGVSPRQFRASRLERRESGGELPRLPRFAGPMKEHQNPCLRRPRICYDGAHA